MPFGPTIQVDFRRVMEAIKHDHLLMGLQSFGFTGSGKGHSLIKSSASGDPMALSVFTFVLREAELLDTQRVLHYPPDATDSP